MRRIYSIGLKCMLLIVMVMSCWLVATSSPTEPIKLGAVVPLGDITGSQAAKAMKLAAKEINRKGGILGRQIKVLVEDSQFKPEKGAAALEKLATVDKVDFFIGGMSSSVHLGEIPTLKKYKKITVWIGAASHLCEEALKGSDWYFHLHPWDYEQGQSYMEGWQAIAEMYPEVKMEKWFMTYEEGAFGASSFQSGKAMYKDWIELTGEPFKSAALGGGDYRSVLRHAKEYDPDVFIWVGYGADALPIMEQAKEVGFSPPIFIGSPPGWPPDFGESPLAEGVVMYGMWAPSIKKVSSISKHFWDAYVEEYDEEPATYFSPLGYTNVQFLVKAIKKAGTLEKEALIKALEETKYLSPIGGVLEISPSKIIKHQGFKKQKIIQW